MKKFILGFPAFLLLLVPVILVGARFTPFLDVPSCYLRWLTKVPIHTRWVNVPPSPDGRIQLRFRVRQWTYHDVNDMSSYQIFGWLDDQPLSNGEDLGLGDVRMYLHAPATWVNNSVLKFRMPPPRDQPATSTLTLVNDSDHEWPHVLLDMMIAGGPDHLIVQSLRYHLFEVKPGARVELNIDRPLDSVQNPELYLICATGVPELAMRRRLETAALGSLRELRIVIPKDDTPLLECLAADSAPLASEDLMKPPAAY